jgi:hypothetical protein
LRIISSERRLASRVLFEATLPDFAARLACLPLEGAASAPTPVRQASKMDRMIDVARLLARAVVSGKVTVFIVLLITPSG